MMQKSNLLKQLKELSHDFVVNSIILEKPMGRYAKKNLDKNRLSFLRGLLDLLMNSELISEPTKYYICHKHVSIWDVAEHYNDEKGFNNCSIQTKLWRDKNKIVKVFGTERFLTDVTEYSGDITEYELKLAEALVKYSKVKILDKFALELPETLIITSIKEEQFEELIEILLPYYVEHIKAISSNIDKEALGYIRYILSATTLLSEQDLERKSRLLDLFGE